MQKFIPYEKQTKRQKREADAKRRKTWGAISPVTRKPKNPNAYQREKARSWKQEFLHGRVFIWNGKSSKSAASGVKIVSMLTDITIEMP